MDRIAPVGSVEPQPLHGKVALVTGAAHGLGAASALGLAQAGASVLLCDRDEAALQAAATSLARAIGGPRVGWLKVDVTSQEDVDRAVDLADQTWGRIDILLNNAGTGPQIIRSSYLSDPLRCWEPPVDLWRRIMEVNAIAPYALARAVLPGMLSRGWGRIISVSTTWETMLRPGFASYGPSKAALEAMSAAMARELAGTGVTVHTLHPGGPVDTAQVPVDIGVPRDKLLRPEVMVPALRWLASDASSDSTGLRVTAALWRQDLADSANLAAACEPVAWPQLLRPLITP